MQTIEVIAVAFVAVVALAIFLRLLATFLTICKPSEVVVLSGRKHRLPDGSEVGYTVLHGGRGFRIPILEHVSRMDVRLIPVMVEVQNAYSKGGIPLTVHAIANIKVSTEP
ncbi:MAG: SPFH domain-containing protein, partial [Polyangiaceae bacterium]